MILDLEHISADKPLIFTNPDDFLEAIKQFLKRSIGLSEIQATESLTQAEITTKMAKKILAQKGYGVANHYAFKEVVKHLTPIMKGRECWYKTSDIIAIPNKI